jgi:hypothetical protein
MDTFLIKLFSKGFKHRRQEQTWFRWNISKSILILMLVLSLSSCGDKAKSQEPYNNVTVRDNPQLTNQISEVSPPWVIQELGRSLETYRPQVKILAPHNNDTLQDDTVTVQFEVKDLPIFQDPQFKLGSHLHVILDNQPHTSVYDATQPLILSNLAAGTHTLRVFASRPWDESFKNEGAYAQVTFNVFTKSDDNNPESQPLLTYSNPQGNFGAEPILLDFYLTNAPLQIGGKDISQDEIGDWRIRCTINGESFVLDRWESIYLKGFKPGKNWVKLDFLDGKGQLVKNVFNSTIRSITYEPKGQDTLAKIVRGELSADQVGSIVDPNSITKPVVESKPIPTVTPIEPTPEPQEEEKPLIPEILQPTPDVTQPEESKEPFLQQPESKSKKEGFFKRRRTIKAPAPEPTIESTPSTTVTPDLPEINPQTNIESPVLQPEVTPIPEPEKATPRKYFQRPPAVLQPEVTQSPEIEPNQSTKSKFGKYSQRRIPTPTVVPSPVPDLNQPTIESPTGETLPIPSPSLSPVPEIFNQPALESRTTSGKIPAIPSPSLSPVPEIFNQPTLESPKPVETPATPSGSLSPIPDLNQPTLESPKPVETPAIPSPIPKILNQPTLESPISVKTKVDESGENVNAKADSLKERFVEGIDKVKLEEDKVTQ